MNCRNEQTASLRVDSGNLVTGASPGKLRQLNGNGQVYLGKVYSNMECEPHSVLFTFINIDNDFATHQLTKSQKAYGPN